MRRLRWLLQSRQMPTGVDLVKLGVGQGGGEALRPSGVASSRALPAFPTVRELSKIRTRRGNGWQPTSY
ncbi:hypothetical protein [Deinococcus sp.]|uniref:hypothetical protein n=1 Tax=Deinococcus sp. TaxID=47478 RepID=UPI00286E4817|nr:hypothetical protein [Deinococcus sp.]